MSARRWLPRALGVLALLALLVLSLHVWVASTAQLTPPAVQVPSSERLLAGTELSRFGDAYVRRRGKLMEVGLSGSPEQIGYAHARLLRREMVHNEGILFDRFEQQIPVAPVRWLILDLAQYRYRHVDRGFGPERRREIAAGALAFQPDPFAHIFPTYQRFVYLNALYDISLSFEHSPLIGCTSFTLGPEATEGGRTLLARAFDFEVDPVFDEQKAVFLVREKGRIPFASVAWPGLVGVVSGMNAEGLALVVHGGRAGETRTEGEPVVHALRRVLGVARTVEQAVAAFAERSALVSHIVVAADASGRTARIERVPGRPPFVATLPSRASVTNHFEGPAAADPKNQRVRENTSTLARRKRGDELVASARRANVADAVTMLRDRRASGGSPLPLGDRRAIDALIATHGVVMDSTARVLWVSESPHLLGRFVGFDLRRALAPGYDPAQPGELPSVAEDPLLTSGDYARLRAQPPSGSE